jgi:DNA invertase Pin-like site-specific DNA recombinase
LRLVATACVDKGVVGSKNKRPALDQLVADARRRRFDVLVVWWLDRLGRNLRHSILLLDDIRQSELQSSLSAKGALTRRPRRQAADYFPAPPSVT